MCNEFCLSKHLFKLLFSCSSYLCKYTTKLIGRKYVVFLEMSKCNLEMSTWSQTCLIFCLRQEGRLIWAWGFIVSEEEDDPAQPRRRSPRASCPNCLFVFTLSRLYINKWDKWILWVCAEKFNGSDSVWMRFLWHSGVFWWILGIGEDKVGFVNRNAWWS